MLEGTHPAEPNVGVVNQWVPLLLTSSRDPKSEMIGLSRQNLARWVERKNCIPSEPEIDVLWNQLHMWFQHRLDSGGSPPESTPRDLSESMFQRTISQATLKT
jgi:hypothetical protein